jgi:SAM-dependent methyltransferase
MSTTPTTTTTTKLNLTQSLIPHKPWNPFLFGILTLGLSPFITTLSMIIVLIMGTNKDRSQRIISQILPSMMADMDKTLKRVKPILFRDLIGKDIIDVGCGAGQYLKYFTQCKSVLELEPNPYLHHIILAQVKEFNKTNPHVKVMVKTGFVHDLDPVQYSFDACVLGNVCCEIPNVPQVLREINQLLRPGGKVYFVEHVRHDGFWGVVQDIWNPIWCRITDGCNCNRKTLDWITSVPGWNVESYELLTPAPYFINRIIVGVAVKGGGSTTTINNNSAL